MGGHRPIVWGDELIKNNIYKIHRGLRQMPIDDLKHNNQPKIGVRDGGEYGGEVHQAGGAGEAQFHSFWGVGS